MAMSTELMAAFLLFLGAGLGMPPHPVDPVMEQAAPDNCLVYLSWAASANPRAGSMNHLEQLLADEEIRDLSTVFWKELDAVLARFAVRDKTEESKSLAKLVPEAARQLSKGAGVVYLADLKVLPGSLAVDAGIMLRTGSDEQPGQVLNGPLLIRLIEQFFTAIVRAPPGKVKVDGAVFQQVSLGEGIPPLTWGLHRGYLLVGVGKSAIANQLERFKTPVPGWLEQVKRQLPVKRRSLLAYLDVQKTLEAVLVTPAGKDVATMLEATGVGKCTHLASVSGFDGPELVTQWVLGINGKKTGFLAIPGDKVLDRASLQHIPANAAIAVAARVDLGKAILSLQETLQQFDPRAAQNITRTLEQFEKELPGLSVRRDVFPALGDLWTAHAAPDQGGFLTGWVFTVSVRDQALAQKVLGHLETLIHRENESTMRRNGGPEALKKMMVGQDQVFCLVIPDDDTPMVPAWCLQKERFILTLFPQAMRSYLKSSGGEKSLGDVPEVARVFKPERSPKLLQYTDTRELAKWLYPLSQVSFNALCAQFQRQGVNINPAVFPTAGLIQQHLGPSVMAWYLQEDGLYTESSKRLPGVGPFMVWGQAMMFFSLQRKAMYRQFDGIGTEVETEERVIPR